MPTKRNADQKPPRVTRSAAQTAKHPLNHPDIIDWNKATMVIKEDARRNKDEIRKMCQGDEEEAKKWEP